MQIEPRRLLQYSRYNNASEEARQHSEKNWKTMGLHGCHLETTVVLYAHVDDEPAEAPQAQPSGLSPS